MHSWLLQLVLTLLMVGVPAADRYASVDLDEDHEPNRSETTKEQAPRERFERVPRPTPRIGARPGIVPGNGPGFRPTTHHRVAELARIGAAERRML